MNLAYMCLCWQLCMTFESECIFLCQTRRRLDGGVAGNVPSGLDSLISQVRHSQLRDSGDGEKASMAKLFEQGGDRLPLILYCFPIAHCL